MEENQFEDDFRELAIKASQKGMEIKHVEDPLEAPFSYCLPTGRTGAVLIFSIIINLLIAILVPIYCLIGVIFCLEPHRLEDSLGMNEQLGFLIAICILASGIILEFNCYRLERFVLRRILASKNNLEAQAGRFSGELVISLENPATYHIPKLILEDSGILSFDKKHRRIIIEGVRCRYLIRSHDVLEVADIRCKQTIATGIHFLIGDTPFAITVTQESIITLLKLQFNPCLKNTLYHKIKETLQPETAESPIFDS